MKRQNRSLKIILLDALISLVWQIAVVLFVVSILNLKPHTNKWFVATTIIVFSLQSVRFYLTKKSKFKTQEFKVYKFKAKV